LRWRPPEVLSEALGEGQALRVVETGCVRSVIILSQEGAVTQVLVDDERLKALIKTALVEVLEERKDLLRDAIEETLEEIALARAIEEGRRTEDVSRGEVLSLLEGGR